MNDSLSTDSIYPPGNPVKRFFKKFNLRPYIKGVLPLFLLAHFGHHGISAMIGPLTPMIRTGLKIDYTQIGFIRMAFGLTGGLSQLPAGIMADRLGVRIMVLLGVTGVALTGFLLGFTHSYAWLIVFLVISAIIGAGYHPASAAAISSSVKDEYRGRALGLHLVGGTSAFWIFPLIASPIARNWGWQAPFLVVSIPMAILGIVLYVLMGKRARAEIKRRQEQPEEVEEPTGVEKVQWGKIIPFLAISVITGTVVQSVTSYVSLYATDVLMIPEPDAVALMSITPAVGLFGAPLGGYLSDKLGGMKVILTVAFLSIPIMYFMGNAPNLPILIVLMIAMGLIMNTRMPTSESYLTSNVPVNRRGTIMGIYYFSGTGITAPLAPIIGQLLKVKGFPWTFGLASAITGVIAVTCAGFMWKYKGYNKYPEITGKNNNG